MPYLRQIFLQLGPLFLLFEKIPSSVGESRRICGFFLNENETDYDLRRLFPTRSRVTR